jgi:hypothetical protein
MLVMECDEPAVTGRWRGSEPACITTLNMEITTLQVVILHFNSMILAASLTTCSSNYHSLQ